MSKFIYVYNSDARDKLLAAGYKLLKENSNTFVFLNEISNASALSFSNLDVSYILSDTLTF